MEIARAFLAELVDTKDYTVRVTPDSDRPIYKMYFEKFAGTLKCADRAEIWVEENGHI